MLAGLDGDAAAHKALLTRLSANLRAYFKTHLARIGRAPADAEDLVQETLIAFHTRRHTYDRSKPFTPWVYAIARYRLVDFLRRTKASVTDLAIDEADQVLAEDDPSSVESGLDLERLMAQLTPKARQAIQFLPTVAGLATHPFNPLDEFKGEFRVIAADLRNAKGGQSSGPLEVDRPWDGYTDDHIGLMDHLAAASSWCLDSASAARSSGTC